MFARVFVTEDAGLPVAYLHASAVAVAPDCARVSMSVTMDASAVAF